MSPGRAGLPLAVVGCDFRVASSRPRSRLVLNEADSLRIAQELRHNQAADGFVDLNTCNRNEWIVSSENPRWAAELLRARMKRQVGEENQKWIEPYSLAGAEAAEHVLRVAIGQESLVVGERQIAGQLFRALEAARTRGTSSRILNVLGTVAGRLVRNAIRQGCMGSAAVGVHSLAISYLQRRLEGRDPIRVAVIGLGFIGRRVRNLLEERPQILSIAVNRTIAAEEREKVRPLESLRAILEEVDAAILCTGAFRPVVRSEHLQPRPAERPLLIVDIGIPEQAERVGLPAGVEVAGLDDLTEFHQADPDRGRRDDPEVRELVRMGITEFRVFCQEPVFSAILDTIQRHHRQLVEQEIPRRISERFGTLAEADRERLELDVQNLILEYTNEVFRTIRETSKRQVEETP